jgi:DNA-binding transcriptional MerR regulator
MRDHGTMLIGDVARHAGVSPDTIRHYERLGVLPAVRRTASGFRIYGEPAVRRVVLIRRALAFGFSLRELRGFLAARDRGDAPCRQVRLAAEEKLALVEEQLRRLRTLRIAMRRSLAAWDQKLGDAAPGVPLRLLDDLPESLVTPARRRTFHGRGATP